MTPRADVLGLPAPQRGTADFSLRLILAIARGADPAPGVRDAWPGHLRSGPVAVLATGKAAPAMLAGAPCDRIDRGLMIARDEDLSAVGAPPGVRMIGADHPSPTDRCVAAAREVELWMRGLPEGLPLVVLLSGGTSALLARPAPGLTLADLRDATHALLRAGAPIGELNTVRKHTECLKGGRLGAMAAGRDVHVLVLSDVIGDHLDLIGSGPLWPDPSTFADALAILRVRAPRCAAVRAHLERGVRGELDETPKPGVWTPPPHRIVGSNRCAVDAACEEARRAGFRVACIPDAITGESSDAARAFVRTFRALAQDGPEPFALVGGGETTVRVGTKKGRGGRNQEFALAAALELAGAPDDVVLSVGTDGADGPTPAAGAVAWPGVLARAAALGIDPSAALAEHDSHTFFCTTGGVVPGFLTRGSNVNDVMIAARIPRAPRAGVS
ncbi:MAG: DUF4147 domain-containing protein [Phycisphaerales bacterium]|nr:DUF4147 domain-containing protein [Phycisphaerales bacterium]